MTTKLTTLIIFFLILAISSSLSFTVNNSNNNLYVEAFKFHFNHFEHDLEKDSDWIHNLDNNNNNNMQHKRNAHAEEQEEEEKYDDETETHFILVCKTDHIFDNLEHYSSSLFLRCDNNNNNPLLLLPAHHINFESNHSHRHSHSALLVFGTQQQVHSCFSSSSSSSSTKKISCQYKILDSRHKISSYFSSFSDLNNNNDNGEQQQQEEEEIPPALHISISGSSRKNKSLTALEVAKQICNREKRRENKNNVFSGECSFSQNFIDDESQKSQNSNNNVDVTLGIISPKQQQNNKNTSNFYSLLKHTLSSEIFRIASHSSVRRIDPAFHPQFLNNIAAFTIQSKSSKRRILWDNNITGIGHLVAVADTGLDYDNCYFNDPKERVAFWPRTNPNHRKVFSYRQCVTKNHRLEHGDIPDAHGTHVSGSVAGNRLNNAGGGQDYDGMAKDAKLFFYDLTCGADQSLAVPHDPYDTYLPAAKAGAKVQSNSWGFRWHPKVYEAADRRTDAFAYDFPFNLILFAAGNEPNIGILTPACAKNVLTIGAHFNLLDKNARERMTSFSAKGPTYDNRIKPEICGPGETVTSARSDGDLTSNNCDVQSKMGTSMATPLIAGSAVLVRQYFSDGYYPFGYRGSGNSFDISASALKAALITASFPLSGVRGSSSHRPNSIEGFGGLNLEELLWINSNVNEKVRKNNNNPNGIDIKESDRIRHLLLIQDEKVVVKKESKQETSSYESSKHFCVSVSNSNSNKKKLQLTDWLRVTLSWVDPPFIAEGSHNSLLNDLDLVVNLGNSETDLKSNLFFGNQPDAKQKSATTATSSNSNTEQIVIHSPPPATSQNTENTNQKDKLYFSISVTTTNSFPLKTKYQNFSIVALGNNIMLEETDDPTKCSKLKCPNNCYSNNKNGVCENGICRCNKHFRGVDCSQCDSISFCHGNGKCSLVGDSNNKKLPTSCSSCFPKKENFVDSRCSKCATGFFGPSCSSRCDCSEDKNHGICDKTSGVCKCNENENGKGGFWSGKKCQFCAFDFVRNVPGFPETSSKPCSFSSSWCKNRKVRTITLGDDTTTNNKKKGFIQINDFGAYENSMTCKWKIVAPSSSPYVIKMSFPFFKIEAKFDTISIYSTINDPKSTDVPQYHISGTTKHPQTITSSGNVMHLVFESDFLGPSVGFIAFYEMIRKCEPDTCHGHGTCDVATGKCKCINNQLFDPEKDCQPSSSSSSSSSISPPSTLHPGETTAATADVPSSTVITTNSPNKINDGPVAPECFTAEGLECSGNGACDYDTGTCQCNQFYRGFLCDKACPSHQTYLCGGRGTCNDEGNCVCRSSFTGRSCQIHSEVLHQLSSNLPVFGLTTFFTRPYPTILKSRWPQGSGSVFINVYARRTDTGSQLPFLTQAWHDWENAGLVEPDGVWVGSSSSSSATTSSSGTSSGDIPKCFELKRGANNNTDIAVSIFSQMESIDVFVMLSRNRCENIHILVENSENTENQMLPVPPSDFQVILTVSIATFLVGAVLAAGRFFLHQQSRRKFRAVRRKRGGSRNVTTTATATATSSTSGNNNNNNNDLEDWNDLEENNEIYEVDLDEERMVASGGEGLYEDEDPDEY